MTRLRYSWNGFVRSLQLSRVDLHAFVEGWSDRYFYDKICQRVCRETAMKSHVRTAGELPGETGGKTSLLRFFEYMRRKKLLLQEFKGHRFALIFFLDKDIDDLRRRQKQSNHLIYTEYYHLENYFFRYADLIEVSAAAASLDADSIRAVLGDQRLWMVRVANEWKEWVKLCSAAQLLDARVGCGYSRPSQIHHAPYGALNIAAANALADQLEMTCGLTVVQFRRLIARNSQRIDRIYIAGQHDRVFKGEWYARFLAEDIRKAAAGRAYNANGLESRLLSAIPLSLDVDQAWAGHFKSPISFLVRQLQA